VEASTPKSCGVFWCAVLLVLLGSLRIAAHDLRNPLSAIKGYSEMMIEDAQALQHRELEENGRRVLETSSHNREEAGTSRCARYFGHHGVRCRTSSGA